MINLRQLLTKICESIYSLLSWKNSTTSIINTASEKGEFIYSTVTSISRSGNNTNLTNIDLTPGVWLVFGRVYIPQNTSGRRGLFITSNSATADGSGCLITAVQTTVTRLTVGCIKPISSATKIYLVGYCNTSNISTFSNAGLYAIRLGPYTANLQTTY